MVKIYSTSLIFSVFLVADLLIRCSGEEADSSFGCVLRESNALLKFKASLFDPSNRLSSWNTSTSCCEWQGVKCDNTLGHVIGLDLQNERYGDSYSSSSANMLHGEKLDPSIFDLKQLSFLDLSGNDFHLSFIPTFLGSMSQMQHLVLSNANFSGFIPHQLGNLSQLSVLDLSDNYQLIVDDFTWVSNLSLLRHLNMSRVDLSPTGDLLKVLNMLPFVVDLRFASSRLENRNLQHACVNSTLTRIEYLDLRNNSFHGELPCFLENMTSLKYLDLSFNKYNSCNQPHLAKLTNLATLNLGYNSLQCNVNSISEFISDKHFLEYLSLDNNSCHGDISKIFLNLSGYGGHKLEYLDLSSNNFYGQLPEEIGEIMNLNYLYLFQNLISGPIPTSIGNLSALISLSLSYNQLSGEVPVSLSQLSNLESLYLLDNDLNGTITESHFSKLTKLKYLVIGNRPLKLGVRSNWIPPFQLRRLMMWSCEIVGGEFPQWLRSQKEVDYLVMSNSSISGTLPVWLSYMNLYDLDLSHNSIVGAIPNSLSQIESLSSLDLSHNSIDGTIPDSLCQMKFLQSLDLSGNSLVGDLPKCWAMLNMLSSLSLSSNRLSGVIPDSIGEAYSLEWLQLSDNRFTGELPRTLRNCTQLKVLDIGGNSISGDALKWIGDYLLNLNVLRLSGNEFYGTISSQLCQLSGLQILDLADNELNGNIPHCFDNFTQMVVYISSPESFTRNSLQLVIKGVVMEYRSTLGYVVYADLSNNNLVGEIPTELTRLAALHVLNLSHNHLHGHIPQRIGDMKSLESLDLSNNNLSGNIPGSLSELNFLNSLNLSHNNLTGEIPTGHQLQTLEDTSIYEGNPGLCGVPLPKKCHSDGSSNARNADDDDVDDEDDKTDRIWFCGVVITGFATGFWGAIGVLVFKRGWRYVYFKFTDWIIARILGI